MNDKNTLEGTTTVGLTCKDGVVFASEQRATMGSLIAHKNTQKIFKIDNHIVATIAGSVGDAQNLMKYISAEVALYQLRNNMQMSIDSAATLTSNILHSARFAPYFVQTLLGGVDTKGPKIYSLDPSGGLIPDDFISTGSGSVFAYGVLEDRYSKDLTVDEGIDVAIRAIKSAMERDAYSGNGVLVSIVKKDDGYKALTKEEIQERYNKI